MTLLVDVLEKANVLAQKKSDLCTNMRTLIPVINEQGDLTLKNGAQVLGTTKSGKLSYLEKMAIPVKFFNRCSRNLQQDILREIHMTQKNKSVMLRTFENKVRFIASTVYRPFDNQRILQSLIEYPEFTRIKDYKMDSDKMLLRATLEEPICTIPRTFFAGIQVYNSEIGDAALRVQFIIFEEVCSNGMIVEKINTPFSIGHIRNKEMTLLERFQQQLGSFLDNLARFSKGIGDNMTKRLSMSAEEGMKLLMLRNIPSNILKLTEETLPKYGTTSLDVLSSFTEVIQKYDVDTRQEYERVAGDLLVV